MIVYETSTSTAVRAGEASIAGRRIAGRLMPYGSGASVPFRFDPIERRFFLQKRDATVHAGPSSAGPWSEALSRLPPGPILVGPGAPAEEVRGAYLAAASAALAAGRPVYLLDPEPEGIPSGAGPAAVVLASWRPGSAGSAFPALASARASGLGAAAIFPFLPGWTGEPAEYDALVASAAEGGAASATAIVPASDGEGRRSIVEAREAVDPAAGERFFEVIHHGDWGARLTGRLAEVAATCRRHGLAAMPPRPPGRGEPRGNSAAAGVLEERAEAEAGEHRAARLRAAARWIDESGRDLAAVARDGNFSRVFPFEPEIVAAASAALLREAGE